MAIQGCVPRDIPERGERDRRQAQPYGPRGNALEQSAADTRTLIVRQNAHLLDVRAAVDDVNEDVADRHIHAVGGDPRSPLLRVAGEHIDGCGLIIRDLRQTDMAKSFPREAFDLSKLNPSSDRADRTTAAILASSQTTPTWLMLRRTRAPSAAQSANRGTRSWRSGAPWRP
jgi:hypothetical protein